MTRSGQSYQSDPRVDEYIDALPDWQRMICRRLRDLIHHDQRARIDRDAEADRRRQPIRRLAQTEGGRRRRLNVIRPHLPTQRDERGSRNVRRRG